MLKVVKSLNEKLIIEEDTPIEVCILAIDKEQDFVVYGVTMPYAENEYQQHIHNRFKQREKIVAIF